ncbi:MAG: 2-dehydropantoate 2-reductase [Spirochaetae bacterium HGW-Spirochaetae-9]|nr:MAG: 2-dehydropantoate 2-reductase [Spirochaetae bacterium HGW-Spirochaetae-9]
MNIAIIGIGGIGGFFGGKLTKLLQGTQGAKVYFIARGKQLEAINAKGLILESEEGKITCHPTMATDRIADLPLLDYCLIAVKGYDLVNVLEQLKDRVTDSTVIIPLLNGVDIFERIRAVIKKGYLHPAGVYISTFVESPGHVVQRGPLSTIFLGRDPARTEENRSILALFDAAGIKYGWKDDPFLEIWNKYIFIASFGLVTAETGWTFGEVFSSPEHLEKTRTLMGEIVALGRAKGIALSPSVIEDTITKASKFPAGTRASFQRDMELKDRPDERDLFSGSILRLSRELGIPVPVTEKVSAAIALKKPLLA